MRQLDELGEGGVGWGCKRGQRRLDFIDVEIAPRGSPRHKCPRGADIPDLSLALAACRVGVLVALDPVAGRFQRPQIFRVYECLNTVAAPALGPRRVHRHGHAVATDEIRHRVVVPASDGHPIAWHGLDLSWSNSDVK